MPTTLTGLLIFVVLLAPGFLSVVVTERGPFTRTAPSVLRETASVALASLLCDLVALAVYVPVSAMSGGRLPSLRELVEDGESLWAEDRVTVLITALCLLLGACLVALTLSGLVNNTSGFRALKVRKPISWVLPAKGARTESAWWGVLHREHPHLYRRVTCYLQDGTRVRGWLKTFNPAVDETEDREMILAAPIRVTSSNGAHRRIDTGYITVSARQIQFLHVDYYPSHSESSGSRN